MKNIMLVFMFMVGLNASAQVKFIPENEKSKSSAIVYINIANKFTINTSQEVSVTNIIPSQGNIRMNSDGTFALYVHEINENPVELKYTQTKNGVETEESYPTKYTIKSVPDFKLRVGEYTTSGTASIDKMRKNFKITLKDESSNNDNQYSIIRFYVLYQSPNKNPLEVNYNSDNKESIKTYNNIFNNLQSGDRLFFEKIEIVSQDGNSKKLEDLNLKLVK